MKKIAIQAGHLGIKTNCNVSLRGSTGASGEVEITTAVRDALALLLQGKGFEVKKVDANFNCDATSSDVDYDLFISLHGDMDYAGDGGSGFCDFPEPSTDGNTMESQRIAKSIQESFFPAVGINVKSRSNPNTRYYYMWSCLSEKTPCVLIEMGQIKDPHDAPILKDTKKISTALCNSILKAFNMQTDEVEDLKRQVSNLRLLLDKANAQVKALQKQDLIEDERLRDVVKDLEKVIES